MVLSLAVSFGPCTEPVLPGTGGQGALGFGLLPLGGGTILSHVIARLAPQVADIALNANGDPARFAHLQLPVIPDSIAGSAGPLSGVLAGLDWAATQGATHIVTAAADTPFFPCDLVPQLLLAAERAGSGTNSTGDTERRGGKKGRTAQTRHHSVDRGHSS